MILKELFLPEESMIQTFLRFDPFNKRSSFSKNIFSYHIFLFNEEQEKLLMD